MWRSSTRGGLIPRYVLSLLAVLCAFSLLPTGAATNEFERLTRLRRENPDAYAEAEAALFSSASEAPDPARAERLAERCALYSLSDTSTTSLIRRQGDCAPDSLALGLRLSENPDSEVWSDAEQTAYSDDVRSRTVSFLRVNEDTPVSDTGVTYGQMTRSGADGGPGQDEEWSVFCDRISRPTEYVEAPFLAAFVAVYRTPVWVITGSDHGLFVLMWLPPEDQYLGRSAAPLLTTLLMTTPLRMAQPRIFARTHPLVRTHPLTRTHPLARKQDLL
jgi:Tfp pilus assembly protein PilX